MKKEVEIIKTPLRYPGGKSRAVSQILSIAPHFEEFREPMVGGGSVFLTLKSIYPEKIFWINDINKDLYLFWGICKKNPSKLIRELKKIKKNTLDGKILYQKFKCFYKTKSNFQRAMRFFLLNRITFSGLIDCGGYSEESFKKRFTLSSI